MVMVVTGLAFFGCAASQYKFSCTDGVCDVETAGPATLDLEQEFGETIEVVETKDGRAALEVGSDRASFGAGESGALGPLQIVMVNVQGEKAFFSVRK
jgi:hypothetical protein